MGALAVAFWEIAERWEIRLMQRAGAKWRIAFICAVFRVVMRLVM